MENAIYGAFMESMVMGSIPLRSTIRISKSGVYAGLRGSYFYITGNSEEFSVA